MEKSPTSVLMIKKAIATRRINLFGHFNGGTSTSMNLFLPQIGHTVTLEESDISLKGIVQVIEHFVSRIPKQIWIDIKVDQISPRVLNQNQMIDLKNTLATTKKTE